MNRVNEENATLHQNSVSRVQRDGDAHSQVVIKQIQTNDGDRTITIDKMAARSSANPAANIEAHLLRAVQDPPSPEIVAPAGGERSSSDISPLRLIP